MTEVGNKRPVREPSLGDAILPLIALVGLIAGALALFGLDALDGPIPAALVICAMVAALIIMKNGHPWEDVQTSGQRALSSITSAIFILLAVGALIGTFIVRDDPYARLLRDPDPVTLVVLRGGGPHLRRHRDVHRQLVDDRGNHRRRPGRHRSNAGRLAGDHGGRSDLGRIPGRQALAALGNDDHDRANGRSERLRAHQTPGVDVGSGVLDCVRAVPRHRAAESAANRGA